MLTRRHRQRGFAFLSVLMALIIVAVLMGNYFSVDAPTGKMWVVSQTDRARDVVATVNFRTAETQYFMMTEGRQLPLPELRVTLDRIANLGSGGRFFVEGQQLRNTRTLQTPLFRDQFNQKPLR